MDDIHVTIYWAWKYSFETIIIYASTDYKIITADLHIYKVADITLSVYYKFKGWKCGAYTLMKESQSFINNRTVLTR